MAETWVFNNTIVNYDTLNSCNPWETFTCNGNEYWGMQFYEATETEEGIFYNVIAYIAPTSVKTIVYSVDNDSWYNESYKTVTFTNNVTDTYGYRTWMLSNANIVVPKLDTIQVDSNYDIQGKYATYVTTAPTSANTDGIKICVLSEEPATRYDGWLYVITKTKPLAYTVTFYALSMSYCVYDQSETLLGTVYYSSPLTISINAEEVITAKKGGTYPYTHSSSSTTGGVTISSYTSTSATLTVSGDGTSSLYFDEVV